MSGQQLRTIYAAHLVTLNCLSVALLDQVYSGEGVRNSKGDIDLQIDTTVNKYSK